jgi:hypothetical protein
MILGAAALTSSAAFVAARTRRARNENPPLGRFVDVNGVRIHYVERAPAHPS